MALSVLVLGTNTGTARAGTTTGDGAGRICYLAGDDIHANVSAPQYLGLDASAWNFTASGYYGSASAKLSIVVWINDGSANTSFFVLENETLATANISGYKSVSPSGYSAATATITIAAFLDDAGDYNISANASDSWTGSVSIEESALLAALNYYVPVIILVGIVGAVLSYISKAINI